MVAAKAISTFSREHEVLDYKGGFMDGEALDPDGFTAIARLPGLDVLHGQLVGLTASPLTGLVAGLSNDDLGPRVASSAQIAEQGLVTGEAPAAEEAAGRGGRRPRRPDAEEPPRRSAAEEPGEEEPAEPSARPRRSRRGAQAEEATAETADEAGAKRPPDEPKTEDADGRGPSPRKRGQ